jgi:antibiotic biosynthesis monooxygenase (ABM) superfamily enzyme
VARAVYRVRLRIKPEVEEAFNAWYEGTYIPRLMAEVPHFVRASRWVGELDGERIYVTDYETTTEDMETAITEMRRPERAAVNAEFYAWRDKAITLHESYRLEERLHIP